MIGALRVKNSFNIYCVGSIYEAFCETLYFLVYGELRIEATSIRVFKKLADCLASAIACMLMLHMLVYVSRFIDITKTCLFKYIENFTSKNRKFSGKKQVKNCRPRWLSWMRRLTGDQEVAGSTPAEVGNILSWRLIMK